DEALADADLRAAGLGLVALQHAHVGSHGPRLVPDPARHDVGHLRGIEDLRQGDDDVHLRAHQWLPVGAGGDVGRGGENARRAARTAGTSPLASMSSSAITPPNASVAPLTSNPGRKPAPLKLVARYSSFAPPRPSTAPTSVITPASSITNPNSRRSEKPIVLSTATSPVRSRALIIIALAVTRRIANTTAMPIVFISKLTLPHMVAKLALNACSV